MGLPNAEDFPVYDRDKRRGVKFMPTGRSNTVVIGRLEEKSVLDTEKTIRKEIVENLGQLSLEQLEEVRDFVNAVKSEEAIE